MSTSTRNASKDINSEQIKPRKASGLLVSQSKASRLANGQGIISTKNGDGNYSNDLENLKLPPIHKNGLGQSVQEYGLPQKRSDGVDKRFQLDRSLQYQSSGAHTKEVHHAARHSKENLYSGVIGQDELKLKQQLQLRSESQLSQSSSL